MRMVWVVLVLAAVSWLVVALISEQERGESVSISARLSAGLLRLRRELPHLAGSARDVVEKARAARHPAIMSFGARAAPRSAPSRRVPGEGARRRLVALIELILFVVLVSALFAGAIAAAAMRIGHLGA